MLSRQQRAPLAGRARPVSTSPRLRSLSHVVARPPSLCRSHGGDAASSSASSPPPSSAARRLLDAALLDPLHDLALDFDRTYLTHRCGQSVPLLFDGGGGGGGAAAAINEAAAAATTTTGDDARLDRALLLQRAYGTSVRNLLLGAPGASVVALDALDAAVLLGAFVLMPSADDDDGDETTFSSSPDALVREARAAVELLAQRAVAIARGDRSARGLAAAVSEALFSAGGGGGGGQAGGDYYDPSNSCALTVLRRVVAAARPAQEEVDGLRSLRSSRRTPSPTRDRQQHHQPQHQPLGSPAALALVWAAVASRAGLPCAPLPLPSHTFVRVWCPTATAGSSADGNGAPSLPWLVDPHNAGQLCTAGVVGARLGRNWGVDAAALGGGEGEGGLQEQEQEQGHHHHQLRTLSALALVRLLCNLRESSWAPLPLTGRVRWAPARLVGDGGGGGGSGSGGGAATSSTTTSHARRARWPAASSSPLPHDAVAARLAVRARKGWMGGGVAASPAPPQLAPLAARCVRAVRLLRATLLEMVDADQQQQHLLAAALPRLDRDEGYALCCGGGDGKAALAAYLERVPFAADADVVREFL